MSLVSIVAGITLFGALALIVAWPLFRPVERRRVAAAVDTQQEYQELVATIRDLDFDYRAGVVIEEDYQPMRDGLSLQAVSLLQELDRYPGEEAGTPPGVDSLGVQVEALVRARRAGRERPSAIPSGVVGTVDCAECGYQGQPGDLFCARCGAELEAVCPDCGAYVETGDRFCVDCGQHLVREVAITP